MPYLEAEGIINAYAKIVRNRLAIIRGRKPVVSSKLSVLSGFNYVESNALLLGKHLNDISALVISEPIEPLVYRRLFLSDLLGLRETTVYQHYQEIKSLPYVYGDLTQSRIPCQSIDRQMRIFHVADHAIMAITAVYVEGVPKIHGYKKHTSYLDETGHIISAIEFDKPQYEHVSCSVKGKMGSNDKLLETPSEILRDIFIDLQQYEPSCIDEIEFMQFHSDCISEEVYCSFILSEKLPLRELIDQIAENISAIWLISNGKAKMRLTWR